MQSDVEVMYKVNIYWKKATYVHKVMYSSWKDGVVTFMYMQLPKTC